jgi:hypothetical protein
MYADVALLNRCITSQFPTFLRQLKSLQIHHNHSVTHSMFESDFESMFKPKVNQSNQNPIVM